MPCFNKIRITRAYARFTTDKLLDFLRRLDRKVTIRITPRKPGEPYQEVGFGP